MTTSEGAEPATVDRPGFKKHVAKIAALLSSETFPAGDRAVLKRMTPEGDPPLAFYRFAFRYLPDDWERRPKDWMTIIAGIALMSRNPHNPSQPAGQVLSEAGYSEKRLERLLAAREEMLQLLVLRAARFLSAQGKSVNWNDFAQLILSHDREKSEAARHSIARDYYRHQTKNKE
jgi:CRISPR system Cascade subunit CasB